MDVKMKAAFDAWYDDTQGPQDVVEWVIEYLHRTPCGAVSWDDHRYAQLYDNYAPGTPIFAYPAPPSEKEEGCP